MEEYFGLHVSLSILLLNYIFITFIQFFNQFSSTLPDKDSRLGPIMAENVKISEQSL